MNTAILLGKTVKTSDKNLLEFFYPEFVFRENLFFDEENSVIYVGSEREHLIEYLTAGTKQFVNTIPTDDCYDFDFDDKEELLKFVYSKWGQNFKKSIDKVELDYLLNTKDVVVFNNFIKTYWMMGEGNLVYNTADNISATGLFRLILKDGEMIGKRWNKQRSVKTSCT